MQEKKNLTICQCVSSDITLKFMLFNQLKFLQSQGYEVYATCKKGRWVDAIRKEGIKVKTIGFKRKISPISDLISFIKLYFYFRKERFDVVHVHTLKAEFFGQLAAKMAGIPVIFNTLHGFDFAEDTSFMKKRLILFMQRFSGQWTTAVFSIAKHIIEDAKKSNIASQRKFIYLGRDIDTKRFDPSRFSQEFILQKKRAMGINPDSKVVGIVARLVAEKGYFDLFSAFKLVIKKFPETVLLVIGPEEPEKKDAILRKDTFQYQIENHVRFLGERTDTEELYPLMDVFVLPTHREGLGAVILEASAMERPVVATKVGGCLEAVDNGKTGILVPQKNPAELAKAIICLLENQEEAKAMGKSGREKVVREFSKEIVFERLKKAYQNALSAYGK